MGISVPIMLDRTTKAEISADSNYNIIFGEMRAFSIFCSYMDCFKRDGFSETALLHFKYFSFLSHLHLSMSLKDLTYLYLINSNLYPFGICLAPCVYRDGDLHIENNRYKVHLLTINWTESIQWKYVDVNKIFGKKFQL